MFHLKEEGLNAGRICMEKFLFFYFFRKLVFELSSENACSVTFCYFFLE